jgi:hypothetical protein
MTPDTPPIVTLPPRLFTVTDTRAAWQGQIVISITPPTPPPPPNPFWWTTELGVPWTTDTGDTWTTQ